MTRYGFVLAQDTGRADLLAETALAEEQGWSRLAIGEHLFFRSPSSSALVALAAAAAVTSRVRLLSSVLLLPLYAAGVVAKQVETLDRLSGGRFDLGVGVGGEFPPEFAAVGVPVGQRGQRADAALRLLDRLWTGERVTERGLSGDVVDLALDPAPRGPRPPVWLGGRQESAVRRAARFADVWFPYMVTPERTAAGLGRVRELAADAGRDPAAIRGAVFLWALLGDDDAAARAAATAFVSDVYAQDFTPLADRYLVAGGQDRVRARVHEYVEAGAEDVVIAFACPGQSRRDQIGRFGMVLLPGDDGEIDE